MSRRRGGCRMANEGASRAEPQGGSQTSSMLITNRRLPLKHLGYLIAALCALGCEREPSPPAAIPPTVPHTAPPGPPAPAAAAPAPPNLHAAQQLLDAAKRGGVDSAVALLDRGIPDANVWDGISSGDSTWLEVAAMLQQTRSAETSEAVSESLRQAVPRAPERMLSLIARGVFGEDVCVEQEYDV